MQVADDQFALAAADGDHGINRLDAGLHGLFHGLARHHAGRQAFDGEELVGQDRALAVDRLPERVHHAADQCLAHRHRHDAARALDLVAFLDLGEIAQQHGADLIFFQVHGDSGNVVRELDQFARHDLFEAVNAGDAIAHGDHRADLGHVDRAFVVFNLLAENLGNLVRSNLSHRILIVTINLPR